MAEAPAYQSGLIAALRGSGSQPSQISVPGVTMMPNAPRPSGGPTLFGGAPMTGNLMPVPQFTPAPTYVPSPQSPAAPPAPASPPFYTDEESGYRWAYNADGEQVPYYGGSSDDWNWGSD